MWANGGDYIIAGLPKAPNTYRRTPRLVAAGAQWSTKSILDIQEGRRRYYSILIHFREHIYGEK
jgi:hypothetical protein